MLDLRFLNGCERFDKKSLCSECLQEIYWHSVLTNSISRGEWLLQKCLPQHQYFYNVICKCTIKTLLGKGGNSGFQVTGWSNGAKSQDPKKSLRLPANPKKSTMFFLFTAFVLCISFVIIKLKIEGQTKPHRKVTKLKSKFNLILGWPNRATGAPLLGWPKTIYYSFWICRIFFVLTCCVCLDEIRKHRKGIKGRTIRMLYSNGYPIS